MILYVMLNLMAVTLERGNELNLARDTNDLNSVLNTIQF